MKTSEFEQKIKNIPDNQGYFYTASIDGTLFVVFHWEEMNDNFHIAGISETHSDQYTFALNHNGCPSINISENLADLVYEYAHTKVDERENYKEKIKSMQETNDNLNARNYRLESMLARLDVVHSPTTHLLNDPNEDLPKSVKIDSRLEALERDVRQLKNDMGMVKFRKSRWFN